MSCLQCELQTIGTTLQRANSKGDFSTTVHAYTSEKIEAFHPELFFFFYSYCDLFFLNRKPFN